MPLFFLIFGAIFIDSGLRGNASETFNQLKIDVTGFLAFAIAIIILGVVGEAKTFRPVANGLLILVFVVFFLKNGNQFVSNLTDAIK